MNRITGASLRSEAFRNVRSGTSRGTLFGAIWFVIAAATLLWNTAVTADIVDAAEHYQSAGASIIVVESAENISGSACESMSTIPNVRGAGALRQATHPIHPSVTPGVDLPTFDASPGLVSLLLGGEPGPNGIFVSAPVASALGFQLGSPFASADGEGTVAGIFAYPEDGRRAGLGYAAVQTVPVSGSFDECWVSIWPESDRVRSVVSASVLGDAASADSPPVVSQLNTSLGSAFDGESKYRERATALIPLGTVIIATAIGFAAIRIRRPEFASARLVGIRPLDQAGLVSMEMTWWAGLSSLGALVVSTAASALWVPDLMVSSAQYAGVVVLGGTLAVWVGGLLAVASIHSRRALDYFRNR